MKMVNIDWYSIFLGKHVYFVGLKQLMNTLFFTFTVSALISVGRRVGGVPVSLVFSCYRIGITNTVFACNSVSPSYWTPRDR